MNGKCFVVSLASLVSSVCATSAPAQQQQLVGFASPAAGQLFYVTVARMVNTDKSICPET